MILKLLNLLFPFKVTKRPTQDLKFQSALAATHFNTEVNIQLPQEVPDALMLDLAVLRSTARSRKVEDLTLGSHRTNRKELLLCSLKGGPFVSVQPDEVAELQWLLVLLCSHS